MRSKTGRTAHDGRHQFDQRWVGLEQREELHARRQVAEEKVEVEQGLVGRHGLAQRPEQRRHQLGQKLARPRRMGGAVAAVMPAPHDAGRGRGVLEAERAQGFERAGIVVGAGEDQIAAWTGKARRLLEQAGVMAFHAAQSLKQVFLEGSAGIRGRQERRLDLRVFDPRLLQGLDQEIVDVGALVERDLLAFEIGDRFQQAVLRHENRLALRRRRLIGDIPDRCTRGLRKNRRRFAGVAEIDGADIERFEQRRPGRKLRPNNLVAGGLQLVLERALALEQHQLAVFLETDAQDLVLPVLAVGSADRGGDDADRQHGARNPASKKTRHVMSFLVDEQVQVWAGRQTMSRTATGFGIKPSLWKRSATPCWVVMMSSVIGPTTNDERLAATA